MKNEKKRSNQPTEYVRKSNEEILESAKQAMYERGSGDPEIQKILLKLLTFTPEEDLVDSVLDEIFAPCYSKLIRMRLGIKS